MVLRDARIYPDIIARELTGENALLGRMGQILLIVGSVVNRESLAAWERNAATSTS
jgi:hypothetical protein